MHSIRVEWTFPHCILLSISSRSKKTEDTFSDIARVLNRSTNCGSDLSLLPSTITSLVSCLQIIMAKKARTTNLLDTENPCMYTDPDLVYILMFKPEP